MADLIRWEPIGMRTLRSTIDNLFDEFIRFPQPWVSLRAPFAASLAQVPIDIVENEKEFVIKANVPGIKKENLEVEIAEDAIQISGKYDEETLGENDGFRIRERHSGSFSRVIPVGQGVLTDRAEARYANGVLELKLPKAQPAQPKTKKLEIQG